MISTLRSIADYHFQVVGTQDLQDAVTKGRDKPAIPIPSLQGLIRANRNQVSFVRGNPLDLTNRIETEPAVSLATPQFLGEFQIAAAQGVSLNAEQQFSIVVVNDPNDQTDLLLFDGSGTQIATPRIVGGNVLIAAAVPEPGSIIFLMMMAGAAVMTKRNRRIPKKSTTI